MITYLVVSSFVVSAVTWFFLAAVMVKGLRTKRNWTFCLFAVSVFVWSFGHMFWMLASTPNAAQFWLSVVVLGSSFIPGTYLHFVSAVTGKKMRPLLIAGYSLASILGIGAFNGWVFAGLEPRLNFEYWPIAGPLFPFYFGGFAVIVAFCFYLLIQQYRGASVKVKNQNKYLIIGTAVGFLGGGTNFLLWLHIPVGPFGHGLSVFYILGIGYSVIKYRILDFNEMVVRLLGIVLTSVTLGFLFTFCFTFGMTVLDLNIRPDSSVFWFGFFSLQSCLFVLFVPYLLNVYNRVMYARFISGRFAYRDQLKDLLDDILVSSAGEDVLTKIAERLVAILSLDYLGIYTRAEFESSFTNKASIGNRPSYPTIDSTLLSPLLKLLAKRKRALSLDEESFKQLGSRESFAAITSSTYTPILRSDVILPILVQNNLYGFVLIGPSHISGAMGDLDLLLLENLASRLGLAIKSLEMERMANRVEKLVSLGTMAAGLSHELRNPLVSVRTLVSLLKKDSATLQLSPEFSRTVQRDVRRISGIVEGVSAFAHNTRRPLMPVHIADVYTEVRASLEDRLERNKIELHYQTEQGVSPAMANLEQLIQVLRNIIENGINAISEWEDRKEIGRIKVNVSMRGNTAADAKSWVDIEITDNGPGIPEEVRANVFDPFVTSRDTGTRHGASGTGLGLAIVKKIIEHHNALINVDSFPGQGARFRISIPCA